MGFILHSRGLSLHCELLKRQSNFVTTGRDWEELSYSLENKYHHGHSFCLTILNWGWPKSIYGSVTVYSKTCLGLFVKRSINIILNKSNYIAKCVQLLFSSTFKN
jgi:hypothetical protein